MERPSSIRIGDIDVGLVLRQCRYSGILTKHGSYMHRELAVRPSDVHASLGFDEFLALRVRVRFRVRVRVRDALIS